ncbi:MAG: SulP family inorganic anion transporter [Dermatophilaceae bacterium]|nr:SulP family inorganic anion transporter [Dermatophilaceae bacterium]
MSAGQEVAGTPSRFARHVPGLTLLRHYQRSWIQPDLAAGLILAAILVPQGMAYAELAGLPAVTGLYTTVACLVGYAIMGPSRTLVLGPDSAVSPLILAATLPLLGASGDPATAIALAGMLALLVGAIEIGLGVAKLGFVADLLSKEVQVGYLNGLGITIIVSQLPKLCGFSTDAEGFFAQTGAFVSDLDTANGITLALGATTLLVLQVLPRMSQKLPAILVAIVGATVVSAVFDLTAQGVSRVGALPQGLPRPVLPWTQLSDLGPLLIAAVGITIVSLTDTIATSTSFAARLGEEVDPDQEMIGVGTANLAAGLFQGFAVSSSASRTAVAEQSKSKSQLTSLVGAAVVVLLLLFFSSLLADLPQTVLAAVIMAAALSLIDVPVLRHYWQVRRSALVLSVVASLAVIVLGVINGIVVAISLSILLFFRRQWWPHGEVLGRTPSGVWHALHDREEAREVPGVVVFRWEAPLSFANVGIFRQQMRSLARRDGVEWIVLQCEAVTDIDVTAADMLEQLTAELRSRGVHLVLAEMRTRLSEQMRRYGLLRTVDKDHLYTSIEAAVTAIQGSR